MLLGHLDAHGHYSEQSHFILQYQAMWRIPETIMLELFRGQQQDVNEHFQKAPPSCASRWCCQITCWLNSKQSCCQHISQNTAWLLIRWLQKIKRSVYWQMGILCRASASWAVGLHCRPFTSSNEKNSLKYNIVLIKYAICTCLQPWYLPYGTGKYWSDHTLKSRHYSLFLIQAMLQLH